MIVQLNKGVVTIKPMGIPELVQWIYVKYEFEHGTDHLLPRMTIEKDVFVGNQIFINTKDGYTSKQVSIKVELLDANKEVVRTYKGLLDYNKYCFIGDKPVRPDVEIYIHKLITLIEHQEKRIKELEELGEVI